MSNEATLIDPSGIPHFIGDLSTLDTDVMLLTANAAQFRASGANVHTTFQELSAFYRAPEAHELFSSTQPVKSKSDAFADDLEKVASALSEYASTVKPLVERLESLKAEATAFVNSVSGEDDWRKDHGKVETNNRLWREVNHTVAAFQTAERTCHNKITALVNGTTLTADDGSHGKNTYGYRADDLDHAAETPWGAPVEQEYEGWDWVTHQAGQLWDGFWADGVMGTIHGLGTLVGANGWDAAGEAWKNLAKLGTASALTSATLGTWWLVPDDKLPSWLRDSRTVYKQTVKGFVAWDTWKTNPSRAAGAVGFNVLGLLGADGVGAAASGTGKSAAVARTLSAASKVGRAVDPLTYVGKAGKFTFVKVGDAFTRLRNINPTAPLDAVATGGRYTPSDHLVPPAERPASIPEHAVEYIDDAGKRVYLDTKTGDILNADGTIRRHAGEAPHELSAHDHAKLHSEAHGDRSEELVRSSARTDHATAGRLGEQVEGPGGPQGSHGYSTGDGHDGIHDNSGHVDNTAGASDHADIGSGESHGDAVMDGTQPDADPMGTRRAYEARTSPESTIAVPPKEPGDLVLDTGDHVYFRERSTAVGYDRNTLANLERVKPLDGYHDVVVHGNRRGFFEPGRRNEAGVDFPAPDTHPTHIAEAIRNNPHYKGGPVRLISCHSGTVDVDANGFPVSSPAGQAVANELGVPVKAPTDKVGTDRFLGPGQEPRIFNNGYWRTFLPLIN